MKRWFGFALFLALGVGTTLVAVYLLLTATLQIRDDAALVERVPLIAGGLFVGVVSLVGSIYVAIRCAVYFFGNDSSQLPHLPGS